ncbi:MULTISPECIES: hypothetical protein [Nisaea]|uniref:hypothetical protein n=1 Tax=Nisaea TaxID=390876 RepID=UPI0003FDCA2B|nr:MULTISPECIES: hypothetical protein [Nisaea]
MRYIPKHADDYGLSSNDDAFDAAFLFNDGSEMVEVLGDDWSLSDDDDALLDLDLMQAN